MTDVTSIKGAIVHKFGYNDAVGTSYEAVDPSGDFNWLTSAETVRIAAGGNAADTAAGVGAREVTVYGLDEDFNEVDEAIATAGASASSSTTQTFIRVFRVKVTASGAYGAANTGDIAIETTGGTGLTTLLADEGQSQYAAYTVPAGKTAHVHSISVFVDSGKNTTVRMFARSNADTTEAPFTAPQVKLLMPGLQAGGELLPKTPLVFHEKTDIYFEAKVDSTTAGVAVDFEIELTA